MKKCPTAFITTVARMAVITLLPALLFVASACSKREPHQASPKETVTISFAAMQ